jgi:hypothetical protein
MKILDKETTALFDKSSKFASIKELFLVAYWDIFRPKKRDKLIDCIVRGMNWMAAYSEAKNLKK